MSARRASQLGAPAPDPSQGPAAPPRVATDQHARLERATADLDAPFAVVDLDAFDLNRTDLVRRAGGVPLRLASKSVRARALLDRTLAPGDGAFRGILALTLPEALWLADHGHDDLVVAYPTADRAALRALAARDDGRRIAVMVDDALQLDAIEGAGARPDRPVEVCLELDAGLRLLGGRVRIGAQRSPLHARARSPRSPPRSSAAPPCGSSG